MNRLNQNIHRQKTLYQYINIQNMKKMTGFAFRELPYD